MSSKSNDQVVDILKKAEALAKKDSSMKILLERLNTLENQSMPKFQDDLATASKVLNEAHAQSKQAGDNLIAVQARISELYQMINSVVLHDAKPKI